MTCPVAQEEEDMPTRPSKGEQAFEFFTQAMKTQKLFRLSELQQASGYTVGTIENYIKKKWKRFLTVHPNDTYQVNARFAYYPRNQFLRDLKQAITDPLVPPRITIWNDDEMLLLLSLALIFLWWQVNRRYKLILPW
jgi:hypothetical protein